MERVNKRVSRRRSAGEREPGDAFLAASTPPRAAYDE